MVAHAHVTMLSDDSSSLAPPAELSAVVQRLHEALAEQALRRRNTRNLRSAFCSWRKLAFASGDVLALAALRRSRHTLLVCVSSWAKMAAESQRLRSLEAQLVARRASVTLAAVLAAWAREAGQSRLFAAFQAAQRSALLRRVLKSWLYLCKLHRWQRHVCSQAQAVQRRRLALAALLLWRGATRTQAARREAELAASASARLRLAAGVLERWRRLVRDERGCKRGVLRAWLALTKHAHEVRRATRDQMSEAELAVRARLVARFARRAALRRVLAAWRTLAVGAHSGSALVARCVGLLHSRRRRALLSACVRAWMETAALRQRAELRELRAGTHHRRRLLCAALAGWRSLVLTRRAQRKGLLLLQHRCNWALERGAFSAWALMALEARSAAWMARCTTAQAELSRLRSVHERIVAAAHQDTGSAAEPQTAFRTQLVLRA